MPCPLSHKPTIIALAGGSGSGKTTLAQILHSSLPWQSTVVSLDQFYRDLSHLPVPERAKTNFDHPDSLDMLEAAQVLQQLRGGQDAMIRDYSFEIHSKVDTVVRFEPAPIIIFEGMLALHDLRLVELFDLTVFLNIDEQTRWERKLERDIRERGRSYQDVARMWQQFTRPMHNVFVQPTIVRAGIVFHDSFAPAVIAAVQQAIIQRHQFTNNSSERFV